MSKNSIEQKPSETALFAALRRAIANKEFNDDDFGPDNLAEWFLPAHFRFFLKFKKIQANTKEKLNAALPGLNEYMIARTAFFDQLFVDALNNKTSQIVLLGAGYDSRAYRFLKLNQGSVIFELDAGPTQNQKKKCLKKARIETHPHVKFIPIDFNQESLEQVLENAGFQNHQLTLFIWEGVSYYLNKYSVNATLDFIGRAKHPESIIAFDYTIAIPEDEKNKYYGVKEFAQTMAEHHSDEQLLFSIKEGDIKTFLEQRKLKLVDHYSNEEIEKSFLTKDDGSLLGFITGHFRFVTASPMGN